MSYEQFFYLYCFDSFLLDHPHDNLVATHKFFTNINLVPLPVDHAKTTNIWMNNNLPVLITQLYLYLLTISQSWSLNCTSTDWQSPSPDHSTPLHSEGEGIDCTRVWNCNHYQLPQRSYLAGFYYFVRWLLCICFDITGKQSLAVQPCGKSEHP